MPGNESLRKREYYAHPRNRFWPMMTALLGLPEDASYQVRLAALKAARIGLWDVIQSCNRVGSLDAAIADATYHDFGSFLRSYPTIETIMCNGSEAFAAFTRFAIPSISEEKRTRLKISRMPSTSPANASYRTARLFDVWIPAFGYGFAEGVDVLLRLRANG